MDNLSIFDTFVHEIKLISPSVNYMKHIVYSVSVVTNNDIRSFL